MFGSSEKLLHPTLKERVESYGFATLRPAQRKALDAGLLARENVLVCTPTASGKTLIAEMAMLNTLLYEGGKALYIVPLRALASEKFRQFTQRYSDLVTVALSSSDVDAVDRQLADYDIIVLTSEKLDALIRHEVEWLAQVKVVVVDEIHLLNDVSRGPTLEIVITRLRQAVNPQILGLSATIGNPDQLASWLEAQLVEDDWRPVELKKGIMLGSEIEYYEP